MAVFSDTQIRLGHGSGGRLSQELIESLFLKVFDNPVGNAMEDSAVIPGIENNLAFTTDSFVVSPRFFPGGDIGCLAVCGTVNDLSMMGAEPLYLSAGFMIEEGFEIAELKRIVQSMKHVSEEAGVQIVTGDTKVIPKGQVDGLFINTSGIGANPEPSISVQNAKVGDCILVSGTLGNHGMAIAIARDHLGLQTPIKSDVKPLNHLVCALKDKGIRIHVLRDPTRGGMATVLNEIAVQSNVGIRIEESAIPVLDAVQTAADLTGLDPLYLSNEGVLIAVVDPDDADKMLETCRERPEGKDVRMIGKVVDNHPHKVVLSTNIGSQRLLPMLSGDQLPRIC